ncbi:carboxypeptidase regulatory-like domain-containing protein [Granulicella cerasi]|uniref:Carboxypeptidase regulatory-like domain-containing protein n=1 Tax=Granulicella cerasi TaxID=741063 RepID=A0ABW1Z5G2_9BACT
MSHFFRKTTLFVILCALSCMLRSSLLAQTINGSMSGTVVDSSGARIPGALVVLRNSKSRDQRKTTTNASGVFNFNFVPAATYTLTITREGFETLLTKNIELHPNDQLNIAELKMQIGSENVSVTVEANTDIATSGERSSLITAKDIQKLSTVGRDVSELLRTQAGFSQVQSGLDNSSGSAEVAGSYSGLANYVGNGATANGASVIADGANVTDPGSGAGQTQIVNMDMVQEVKIETSNFGADTAKGPTVITAVGKSGGQNYHGNAQLYVRHYAMNAQDWFAKYQGLPQLPDRYLYPGVGVGGPLIIPGTSFNKNHKLTFQFNGEGYVQQNSYAYGNPTKALLQALVPTQAMRNGDFSVQSLSNYLGVDQGTLTTQCNASGTLVNYLHQCALPATTNAGYLSATGQTRNFTGGVLTGGIEPNMAAVLNGLYPLPTGPTVKGFNYKTLNTINPNLFQTRLRVDYAMNDSNKIYVVYNGQFGTTTGIPENIYYSPGTSNSAILGGVNTLARRTPLHARTSAASTTLG